MKYLDRSLNTAESRAANSFHCKTPNCRGWCEYEDDVNWFRCPICAKLNCLTCKAIHEGQTCKEYQEDLRIRAENDVAAKKTQQMLEVSNWFINIFRLQGKTLRAPACFRFNRKYGLINQISLLYFNMDAMSSIKSQIWAYKAGFTA